MDIQSYLDDVWNGWTIIRMIGQGAFGRVYCIEKREYGQVYQSALKVLEIPKDREELELARSRSGTDDAVTAYYQEMVEDISAEISIMSRLQGNSHIVSYQDHAVVEKKEQFGWVILMRMELLTSFSNKIRDNSLDKSEKIKMGIDICKAIEACESQNIIHRDIKPGNILVSDVGHYKLGDFGIARQIENSTSILSSKGTFPYMAPEVYKLQPYNATVDIYSLGIMLYHLFNHNRIPLVKPYPEQIHPFEEKAAEDKRMMGAALPVPQELEDDNELAQIIIKACSYDPKKRYRCAAEMRKALEDYLKQPDPSPPLPSPSPPKKLWIILLFAVLILGGGIGAYQIYYAPVVMPELTGLTQEEAQNALEANHLALDDITYQYSGRVAKGKVISQSVDSWEEVRKRTKVNLVVSKGAQVVVPDIVGLTEEEARKAVREKGLKIALQNEVYSDVYEAGVVIRQSPASRNKVDEGTEVKYTLSKGKEQVTVPNVAGMAAEEAAAALESAGLSCESATEASSSVQSGNVIRQSVEAESVVEKGTSVTITVSSGAAPTVTPTPTPSPSPTPDPEPDPDVTIEPVYW